MKRVSINNLDFEKKKKLRLIAIIALIVVLNALLIWVFATNSGDKSTENTLADTRVHETEVPEGYTAIYDVDGLSSMSSNLSGKYILMSDIDLTGNTWDVIGTSSSSAFTGTLDGNNYTISNLNIESSNQYVGMFGYVSGGTIKNLTLENARVKSTYSSNSSSRYGYVGGLVGYATSTTIENIGITGSVETATENSNGIRIGGLVGETSGTITNSYSNAKVVGNTTSGEICIGGLAGDAYTATITNAYATGEIRGISTTGTIREGGLAGYSGKIITTSYATGNVTGTSTTGAITIGGLVGKGSGTITNIYSTGNVIGETTGTMTIGGLVGEAGSSTNAATTNITNAYSTGNVTGETTGTINVGGLIGQASHYSTYKNKIAKTYSVGKVSAGTSGTKNLGGLIGKVDSTSYTTVTSSYWSPETTGVYTSATTGEQPKLLQEMLYMNTYDGWDFDTVWDIDERNTLPYLQEMPKPASVSVNENNYDYVQYSQGSGTAEDPFIITSKEQLQGIKNGLSAHYQLRDNIDVRGIENFEPIGNATTPFTGTLDGNNYTISNIKIESANQYVGMFGYVSSGTIKNLTLENITVKSTYSYNSTSNYGYVGGLVGYTRGTSSVKTTIENVGITGRAEGTTESSNGMYVGGLVGASYNYTDITNSHSNAEVIGNVTKGAIYIGGFAGYTDGKITNVYATGDVTGTSTTGIICAGGLVGRTEGSSSGSSNASVITNAYSTGDVTANLTSNTINIGGLIGKTGYYTSYSYYAKLNNTYAVGKVNAQSSGTKNIGGLIGNAEYTTVTSSYWSPETTGVYTSATKKEQPKLLQEMFYMDTYDGWDFDTVWKIDENTLPYLQGMPKPASVNENNYTYLKYDGDGTAESPFIIRTKEQLQGIKNNLNQVHYKLGNNIDVTGIENFESIGNATYPFTGTLDGVGFTISNINIESSNQYVGLFGYTNGAIIKDLTLDNVTVKSNYISTSTSTTYAYIGGIAGFSTGSTLQNIKITGESTVESNTQNANTYIGGVVGKVEANTNIIEVNSNAEVFAIEGTNTKYIGGLIGENISTGMLEKCYATGNVTANGGRIYAGGLVGYASGKINTSYATGNINIDTTGILTVGGLIGYAYGSVTDVYSTGDVTGNTTGTKYIGGLIGQTFTSGTTTKATIANAYAVGKITTNEASNVGGLIGYASSSYTTVNNSYWSPETTGQHITAVAKGNGKLLSNMLYSDSYDNWNFENVWSIQEGQTLPYLQGMDVPSSIAKTNYNYIEYDGKGTVSNPNIIRTEAQLQEIRSDLIGTHYELANDIVLTKNFEPIGNATYPFSGTLDGCGHTVSNLNIDSAEQNVGMFGYASTATIKNLILKDISVRSTYSSSANGANIAFVGGLVGYAINNTLIEGIEILGESTVENVAGLSIVRIGGVVGTLDKSSLSKVGTTSNVNANSTTTAIYAGGIAGYIAGSNSSNLANITNAYSTGEIKANSTSGTIHAGGLTGYIGSYTSINNVYAVGKIEKSTSVLTNYIGGLVGSNSTSNVEIVSSYYSPETTGQFVGVIGKSERFVNMLKEATYEGWFDTAPSVWTIEEENTLPYFKDMEKPASVNKKNYTYLEDTVDGDGTSTNPYIIRTEEQLQNLLVLQAGQNTVYFELGNDIEITKNFTPIGDNVCPFSSVLDGKGYTIRNMKIEASNQYIGMFGYTSGAVIKNLILENETVKSTYSSTKSDDYLSLGYGAGIGALIGYADTTTVENVKTIGQNKIESNTEQANSIHIGGLIGYVSGTSKNTTIIRNSSASGQILGESTTGIVYVGGLIGSTPNADNPTKCYITIENTYSTANVVGTSTTGGIRIGGLLGYQMSNVSITNSYATGEVVANSVSATIEAGGLVGWQLAGTITNTYAVGKVSANTSGTKRLGGLVGFKSNAQINSSYFSPETTNQMPNGSGKEKFLCSMLKQNSYEGWDFDTVWAIKEGETLPYLQTLTEPEEIKKENYEYVNYEGDGTEGSPYLIKTEEQLRGIKYILDGVYYKLANDIELQENFEPLGNATYPFKSTFDGDNHTISNLNIESDEQYVGMFGYVSSGAIKNLTLQDVNVKSTYSYNSTSNYGYVGGLVGYAVGTNTLNTTIENVKITGISKVENIITTSNGMYVGGLIGFSGKYTAITNVNSNAEIIGNTTTGTTFAGGLMGANRGTVTNAYSTGNVRATSATGEIYVGGLIGSLLGTATEAYSTGNVRAASTTGYIREGGLVGYTRGADTGSSNASIITNAYATSNVIGNSTSGTIDIGGLVGNVAYANSYYYTKIANTYSVGKINAETTGTKRIGGLIGVYLSSTYTTVTDSYWSPKTTGQETSAGGDPKTIQELIHRETYGENWDFTDTWAIDEGTSLAYLRDLEKPEGIEAEDLDFETRVSVHVKDDEGTALANAEFVVKDSTGNVANDMYGNVVSPFVTNAKGVYNILDLEPGVYTLEQTKAPTSYIKDTTIRTFKLTEEGTTVDPTTNEEITLDIVNERYKLQLRNLKKDTDKPISGAVIGLFDETGNAVTGIDGKVIRGTTDANGDIVLMKMPAGTYKYKQTVAKLGYVIDENEYTVTIAEDGTVTFGEDNSGVIYNEKIKIDITANKVWNDNDNLKGKRPDSVKINLYKWYKSSTVSGGYYYTNKELVDSVVLTEVDNWSHTFTVDKYNDNSVQIYYTVEEEAVNEGDFKFYTGAVREYTVTNTYILPSNIPYKVEHYKQNDTLDGYDLAETEEFTGTLEKTATAVAKNYDGYILNANVSGTIQKGIIVEDGSLVLKLYYDKLKTATFNVNISNLDAESSDPIANTKYDVWIQYSDGTKVTYPVQTTNSNGNISIPTILGKAITRVYFKQTKVENGHKIDSSTKYVEVKVDGVTGELSLTGSKSQDIIASLEDTTIYITQTNEQMTYSNRITINTVDNVNKDIKIGYVSFEVVMPDGAIKNVTTNEEGIINIDNVTAPGVGTYLYEITQLNKVNGYNEKTEAIYVNITFNSDGIITKATVIRGDAKASVIKETSPAEEVVCALIEITETREINEIFSNYTLKIVERDKDTNEVVTDVKYKVTQTAKTNGMNTVSTEIKATNENGVAIFDVSKASEIAFTIRRIEVPSEYKFKKEEIQVKVRNNNGEYELVEEVPGVTIDTENNEIIVNRIIYKPGSEATMAERKINNTIYITKIDEYYRPLQNVDMQLRAYKCKNGEKIDKASPIAIWDLTTDSNGLAKITDATLVETLGSEFPEQFMEEEGRLEFWITEINVPVGYERPETDIGFEVQYEFSNKGKLEIITMNVLDGASYYHIADQTYDQYEEEQYIQADIKLKVINPHSKAAPGEVKKYNTLKIEKVDSENSALKLANATFKVTLTYPETTLSTGKTKIFKTSTEVKTGTYGLASISNLSFPEGTTKVEIQELSAPSGYILDSTKIILNVTNTAGVITVSGDNVSINEDGEILVQIENTKKELAKPYSIVIQKRDSNNNAIIYSVAEFDVKVSCGGTTKTYNRRTRDGKTTISNLNGKGTISIEIKEVEAPVGYKLNEEVKVININKEKLSSGIELRAAYDNVKISNDTIYIDVYDEPDEQIPVLQIRKVDSKNTYIGLENAKFTVTLPDENNTTRRVSTSQNGYANIILANGISGRYIIEETEAPNGYYTTKKIALDIVFDGAKNVISCDVVTNLGEEYSNSTLQKSINGKRINIIIPNEKIETPRIKTYGIHIDKVSTTSNYIKLNNIEFDIKINEEFGLNYSLTRKTDYYRGIYVTGLTGNGKIKVSLQELYSPSGYVGDLSEKELIFTRDPETQEIVLDTDSLINIDASNITIDNTNHMIHIRVKNTPKTGTIENTKIPEPGVGQGGSGSIKDKDWIHGSGGTGIIERPVGPGGSKIPIGVTEIPTDKTPIGGEATQIPTFEILVEKVNVYNRKIKVPGAQYAVYVLNETTNEQISAVRNTGSDGKIRIEDLVGYGDFTITIIEINSPGGYAIDEYRHTIKIHRDEATKLITIRETDLGENAEVKVDNINKVLRATFKEAPGSIGLGIYKRDSEDEELGIKDIEFKVVDTETNAEYSLTTGEEGMDFTVLPAKSDGVHTFKITEETKPEGYIQNTPFVLSVRYLDGLIQSAEVTSGPLDLAHVEKQTTEYIELSILNKQEVDEGRFYYDIELVKGDAYYPDVTFENALIKIDVNSEIGVKGLTKTALTDEEGKIYINHVYSKGKVDIDITELVPPPGRRFDTKLKAVRLDIDAETGEIKLDKQTSNVDTFIDNTNRKILIRVRNYPDGTFVIGANKVDADDKDLVLTGAEYKVQLEGTSSVYYAKEYISGLLTFSEIPMPSPITKGTYTYIITETKAPLGYELDSTPIRLTIEVTNNSGIITITDARIESGSGEVLGFGDEFIHLRLTDYKLESIYGYNLTLTKVDERVREHVLKDALIGIQVKAESGEQYYKEVKTDAFGKINLNEIRGTGRVEVTVTEVEAPETYIKEGKAKTVIFTRNPETGEITIEPNEDEVILSEVKNGNIEIVLKNTLDLSKGQYVTIRKVHKNTDIGLEGAIIILRDENGEEIQRRVTDENGYATFIVKLGKTYSYEEVNPPIGYTLNETIYSFNVLADGAIEDVVGNRIIENTRVTMKDSFTITKKRAGKEVVLPGATIGIFDAEGNKIGEAVTGIDGTVVVSGLEVGEYYYKEITAPVGYILNETEYHFTVENDGAVRFAENANKIIYNGRVTMKESFIITKKRAGTEVVLSGAVIGIFDEDGNKIEEMTTGEAGIVTVSGLEPGEYYYKEITAPTGYVLNETEYHFTVENDGTITFAENANKIIYNTRVTMKESFIITKKRAGTEVVLSGAVIGVFDTEGNKIAEATTGETGTVTVSGLEPGEYYYKEITAPVGYILNETEYHFTVENDGTITFAENANRIIYNTRVTMKENFIITKKRAGTEVVLSGAVIGVFDTEGNKIAEATTGEAGTVTVSGLEPGEYYYKEITAPVGYILNETEYHFTVENDGAVRFAENANKIIYNGRVTMKDSFTITKKRAGTEVVLSGAVIGIFDTEGNKVIEAVTNENGIITVSGLEVGEYYYKEITAPTGYVLNETEYHFTVENDGTITFAENANKIIYNTRVTMKESFIITKKRAGTEVVLSGAVIGVFDTEGNKIAEATTGETGTVTVSGLEPGEYYYKEITAPVGYILNETEYHFTVANDGTVTFAQGIDKIIYNTRVTMTEGLVVVKKRLGTNIVLSGAVIGVFGADGNEIVRKTTGETGTVTFTGLEPGEYYYKELEAPEGYILNETEYHFIVTNDGIAILSEGSTGVIYNGRVTMKESFIITKKRAGTEVVLSGAVIGVFDTEGNKIAEATTGEAGTVTVSGLEPGEYYYKEITAPVGYILNETEYHFTVANDGTVTFAENANKIIYNTRVTMKESFIITKKRAGTEIALSGAVIGVFDEDGNKIEEMTTGEAGTVTVSGLEPGEYYYKEITAPVGYILNETEYHFTVANDGTVKFAESSTKVIYNDIETINVTVHKVWVDTEAQKTKRPVNIIIQLKNGNTVVASKTVSNTTENIAFENLPKYDTNGNEINYTVEETEENVGDLKYYVSSIVKNADGTFTITNTFTVPKDKVNVTVHKVWVDTEEQRVKRPANIVIQIKNEENVVAQKTIVGNDALVVPETSITFENLPKYDANGNEINYTVEETEENAGDLKYYVSSIVRNADGTYTLTNTFTVPAELLKVTIKKVDETTKGGLQGAVIELILSDGTRVEGTTDINGYVTFEGLEPGETYTYIEKTPPIGYSLNTNEYSFRVNELGEIEDITGNRIIENELELWNSRITISVHKIWIDTEGQRVKRPANIVIQVKNGDTVVASKTVSNTTENITFENLAKYDENRIEIKYVVDEVEENTEDLKYYVANVVKNADETYTITNTFTVPEELLKVTIRKIDAITKQGLKGATIHIQDTDGNEASAVTDDNGYVTFTGLIAGKTYTYKETVPPTGYSLNTNEYSFRVNEVGEIEDIVGNRVIENNRVIMLEGLTITKMRTGTIVRLPGAVIGIFRDDSSKVEEKTTGEDGTVTFTGLEIGNYYYQEITAPAGYILDDTQYYFAITNEGKIELAEGSTKIIYNARATMVQELTITKMQSGTTIKLPGAIIGIFNNEGKEIERKTTNADGTVTFSGLEVGEYYYKEIEAPDGYTLNNTEYHFEITDKGIIANEENLERIIYNDIVPEEIRVDIPIYKMDAVTKALISGAKIGLYDEAGNVIEEKTTTEDGKVVFASLIAGRTYKYKEIASPKGYVLNDTVYSFKIEEDGSVEYLGETIEIDGIKYVVIYNEPLRVDIPIYKLDILTKEILLGAKIGLYDSEGNAITEGITGEDGRVIFTGLIAGRTYKYKEIEAPAGYILNDTIYSFKIAKDGTIEYSGETIEINGIKYIAIYNEPLRIDVPIYKVDIVTKALISGAKIGLYDSEGNAITEGITGEDGKVVFSGLVVGRTYRYKEIVAPRGYVLNNTIYSFKIAKDGTIEYLGETIEIGGIKYIAIYNEPLRIDVPIYKVDILTKALISGAKIGLYDEAGNVIEEKTTGEDGKVVFTRLIPGKTYNYKEITAPKGYVLNDIMYSFKISENGTIQFNGETIEIDGIKYIAIYNEALRIDVPIYKADILTKALLSGAKIGLYDNEGKILTEGITGEDGKVVFSKLIVGKTYKYKEIVSPTGYVLNNEMYSFEIAEDGTIIFHGETIEIDGVKYIVIYNEPLRVDVPIYKVDIVTKALISGAKIGLYDETGNIIEEKVTAEEGRVVFSGLIAGKTYKYKEITAPVGYVLNNTTYSFKIAKDGTIEFLGETIEIDGVKYIVIYNEPLRIDVPIYKKDILTEELLSGAVIGLYDTSGKAIEIDGNPVRVTTDETGKAVFKGLKPGTVYQYKEEVPPKGYEINSTMYAFRIKGDGTIVYDSAKGIIYDTLIVPIPVIPTPPNTDTKLPQTGINTIVLGVLMMLTGISVCGTLYYKKEIM